MLQLAKAYLACNQPSKVLECVSRMQGLSAGRTPLAGLLQLSSLALLQQGKVTAASAQLCAWLQQGVQSTEEACAAVRAFLAALHTQHSPPASAAAAASTGGGVIGSSDGGERAAAVQAVAAAVAERCRSAPAVALEVIMQILAEQVRIYRYFSYILHRP